MARNRTFLPLVVLIAAAAAFFGHRTGFSTAMEERTATQTAPSAVDRRPRPHPDRVDPKESLRLLLGRPGNSRTRGEAWAIIRQLSIGEIQDALHQVSTFPESDATRLQNAMLYQRWAQIDPVAAMEAVTALPKEEGEREIMMTCAFVAWMKQDPDAAYQWGGKSPEFEQLEPSRMMANLLSGLTPAMALEKADSYGAEVHKATLLKLARDLSTTPEDRAEFLAELARSGRNDEEKAASLGAFVETWGRGDPLAALGAMDGFALDDGTKQQSRNRITRDWAERDPTAALAWLAAAENAQPLKSQVDAYTRWAAREPESALNQLDQLERQSPKLREGIMDSLVGSHTRGGWTPWGESAQAKNSDLMKLKAHYTHWSERAPGQAAAWLANQDSALQGKITSTGVHENR